MLNYRSYRPNISTLNLSNLAEINNSNFVTIIDTLTRVPQKELSPK